MTNDPMAEKKIVGAGERLRAGPSPLLAKLAFGHELTGTDALFAGMNHADMAHLVELHGLGLYPTEEARAVARGLLELEESGPGVIDWDPALGDIYNNRMSWLRQTVGGAVDRLHTGRARREVSTIGWHLACRVELYAVAQATIDLISALEGVASSEGQALVPDYTYLQRAQPTRLGHYLLGFAQSFVRDLDRYWELLVRLDQSPAGSGSVNGTSIALDRFRLAQSLGTNEIVTHTRDAMWQADLAFEVSSVAVSPMVTASRLANDLIVWTAHEFGFFEPADQHSRTSVIMPQKKNPYGLTHIRGMAHEALGSLVAVAGTQLTNTGQPDSRLTAYIDHPDRLSATAGCLQLLAEMLSGGSFNRDRMAEAANEGFLFATDLCDWMTSELGIANRVAHRIVGRAIRDASDTGRTTIDADDLQTAADELSLDVSFPADATLDLSDASGDLIESRKTPGGAGSDALTRLVEQTNAALADHRRRWNDAVQRWASAENSLLAEIESLADA